MISRKVTILAPAKINLYFGVTGIRTDGYHEVETILQTVNVFDRVTVETFPEQGGISVFCRELSGVPENENTAYRAASAFLAAADDGKTKVGITIEKKIPDGSGLGGGSSDAAAVILALNSIAGDKFTMTELSGIGASVGADVPFCIKKGTVKATGFGENIVSCTPMPDCHIVIAVPDGERISTAEAYGRLAPEGYPSDFENAVAALLSCNLKTIASTMKNDFESILPDDCGSLKLKKLLLDNGAVAAQLSGSGSAVFGCFDSLPAAKLAREIAGEHAKTFLCVPARRDYVYIEI